MQVMSLIFNRLEKKKGVTEVTPFALPLGSGNRECVRLHKNGIYQNIKHIRFYAFSTSFIESHSR